MPYAQQPAMPSTAPRANARSLAFAQPRRIPANSVSPVHRLQRTAGNQAVLQMMRVGHLPSPRNDRPSALGNIVSSAYQGIKSLAGAAAGLLQRKCVCGQQAADGGECEECRKKRENLSRSATSSAEPMSVPPIVHEVLRSSGQPLDASTRAFMEPRFGYDFSRVRVHADAKAAESAKAVNALAYTVGEHIAFAASKFAPITTQGRSLLAHELTHVVQQHGRVAQGDIRMGSERDESEHQADAFARLVTVNPPSVGPASGASTPESNQGHYLGTHGFVHVSQHQRVRAGGPMLRRVEGPQSFADTVPGSETIDPVLAERNAQIERSLLNAADEYYKQGDLRWFFTYSHGAITRQINKNILAFERPNALLRLNIHFAEEFLRALYGQPHEQWRRAFQECADKWLTERCGKLMANVHINIDLSAALNEVGCIPPADYGNMLVSVNQGAHEALVRLRGRAIAATERLIIGSYMDNVVRAWRNAAFAKACNASVPAPANDFASKNTGK
jgi:hypothetical protein